MDKNVAVFFYSVDFHTFRKYYLVNLRAFLYVKLLVPNALILVEK